MAKQNKNWIAGLLFFSFAALLALQWVGSQFNQSRAADPPVKGTPIPNAAKPEGEIAPADMAAELKKLREELKAVRESLPDQSHAMKDVSYHFTNLKFAADQENWSLAQFYFGETKQHLKWAVSLKPIRKDNLGREIDLKKILEALETTPLTQMKKALDDKDRQAFTASYRATMEGCYACHKASDKPYLRLQIPEQPETRIVNFDPKADWPK